MRGAGAVGRRTQRSGAGSRSTAGQARDVLLARASRCLTRLVRRAGNAGIFGKSVPRPLAWRIIRAMANGLTYVRKTTSPEATKQLAGTLAPYLRAGDVIVLSGDLGAGKTQFVQGVAAALGVRGPVTSPTFNILLSYLEGSLPLHHFDLYRLDDADELEDIGFYDTLDADGASFVEWGERFPDALPYGYLEVRITVDAEGNRVVRAHAFGDRARCLLTVWAKDSKSRLVKCAGGFA